MKPETIIIVGLGVLLVWIVLQNQTSQAQALAGASNGQIVNQILNNVATSIAGPYNGYPPAVDGSDINDEAFFM